MENSCYYGSTCETCSINNTALFNEKVNKMNPHIKNTIVELLLQTVCLPFHSQGARKYTYFFIVVAERRAPYLLWKYGTRQNDKVWRQIWRFYPPPDTLPLNCNRITEVR